MKLIEKFLKTLTMKRIKLLFSTIFFLTLSSIWCSNLFCANSKHCNNCWKYDTEILPGASNIDYYLPLIKGKKVCIVTNQTGIIPAIGIEVYDNNSKANLNLTESQSEEFRRGANSDGLDECKKFTRYVHIVDTLKALGVDIVCIMSPEHGFRGTADAGEKVSNSIDPQTGIEIRSLYGTVNEKELMKGFDVVLFDLQDVGVRFYTYYVTMVNMMKRCAKSKIPIYILDRPNPIGFYTDGPILPLTKELKSGVGALPIPIAYGMTMGELAQMANGEHWLEYTLDERGFYMQNRELECELHIVKCLNYSHSKHYRLPVKPSPNLPNMRSIYLYPSICYFEGTDFSIGRGTDFPFQVYGSPEMENCDFSFTPRSVDGAKNPPRLGEECFGVDLRKGLSFKEINRNKIDLSYIIDAYNRSGNRGLKFFRRMFDLEIGNLKVKGLIVEGKSIPEIKQEIGWDSDVEKFKKERVKYMLYD